MFKQLFVADTVDELHAKSDAWLADQLVSASLRGERIELNMRIFEGRTEPVTLYLEYLPKLSRA